MATSFLFAHEKCVEFNFLHPGLISDNKKERFDENYRYSHTVAYLLGNNKTVAKNNLHAVHVYHNSSNILDFYELPLSLEYQWPRATIIVRTLPEVKQHLFVSN